MAIINPEWVTKQVGSFQTADEMNTLAAAVKNNAVELQTDVNNLSTHISNKANPHEVTKLQLDLENVDNVSDANKPVSIAQAAAIAAVQADVDSHESDIANPHSVTKVQVGLGNVDNTSDISKPISTATQTALDLKADEARQIISGAGLIGGGDLSTDRTLSVVSANDGITVNVDNIQLNTIDNVTTTSTTKPLSANQGKVLNDNINAHKDNIDNPHGVTKAQVGLSSVDNTTDLEKPVSTAQQTALNLKVDKAKQVIAGNGLTGGGDLSADRTLNVGATDDSVIIGADGIKVDTQNTLTSTSITKPLAANQGKVLNESLVQLGADLIKVDNKITKPMVVSEDETPCGTFNLFGETHTIYERSFVLENIISTVGYQGFTLSDEPLGYNLYASIEGFSISSGKSIMSKFYNNSYEISDISVDNEMKTIVTIACKETTLPNLRAIIHLKYVKFFGDIVEFNITVPDSIDPANVDLSFPKLKYNKKMAASLRVDDSYSIWNWHFAIINKKNVSDEVGANPWSGATPWSFAAHMEEPLNPYGSISSIVSENPIEYSDGAGIKHRYASTSAAWCWAMAERDTQAAGGTFPWIFAKEMRYMQDFGCSFMFHDIEGYIGGTTYTQDEFNNLTKIDGDKFKGLTDRFPKIFTTPNGNPEYVNYGWGCPYVQLQSDVSTRVGEDGTLQQYKPFANNYDLWDKTNKIIMQEDFVNFTSYKVSDFYNQIETELAKSENDRIYRVFGFHKLASDNGWQDFFKNMLANHGASGADDVWFPSIDEFFEYILMRDKTVAVKSVSNKTITYKLFVPTQENFWFRSLSLLLSGITDLTGITVSSSDNCKGTSFAISNGKLMVNLDFNADLEVKAEKYVSKFETSLLYSDYEDAQYFVQQLKVGIKEPYQTRLNNLVGPPTLTALSINSGAATTNALGVTLTTTFTGTATAYMISENADFSGASWQDYVTNMPFTLSDVLGAHTLYVKLKNDYGESSVMNASITYAVEQLVLSSASINSGSADTSSRNVNVTYVSTGSPATYYMISENADFSGASWQTITGTIPFTLSDTAGAKTIYLKLKNNYTETSAVSDTINYTVVQFSLSSVSINAGDTDTTNKNVNVTIASTGNNVPTQYKISENADMSGANWQTYTSNVIPFTLSDGYGAKTVYVQITDGTTTSTIVSDSINVPQPVGLTSISINSGATSTSAQTVSVAMVTTGTPTYYMISESPAFTGASWIAFTTPVSFLLSTGYAAKTIYVKVKDANGESSVVNASITYSEPSQIGRKMIFCVPMDTAQTKITTNPLEGVTWNNFSSLKFWNATYGVADASVYDTAGTSMGTWTTKPVNDTAGAVSHFLGGSGAVTNAASTWGGRISYVTGFTNNTAYSKLFFNNLSSIKNASATAASKDSACPILLKNLSAGTYRVKIYVIGRTDQDYGTHQKYFVNDSVEKSWSGASPTNPFDSPLTFEVSAWNGCLVIGFYSTIDVYGVVSNLIEIERIA